MTNTTASSSSSSTTEYLPQSLTFLIANFQSFITIKLDSTNYFAWKTQVENALQANSLFDFASGSHEKPAAETLDTSGNKIPNPEYIRWNTVDRMLLSCLIATLTPAILPHIVGTRHTHQIWSKLEEKFSLLSRTHLMDIKRRIYSLKKTTSMEQYLDNIKGLLQKLEASGSHMDDEDVVFHTLNGLPDEVYRTFKQAIRTRSDVTPLTFSALSSMLMAEDLVQDTVDTSTILVAQHQSAAVGHSAGPIHHHTGPAQSSVAPTPTFQFPVQFGPQAPQYGQNMSQFGYSNNGGNRNNYKGNNFRGSRNNNNNYSSERCQICGKNNHLASHCYYRQDLNYRPPQYNSGPPKYGTQQYNSGPPQYGTQQYGTGQPPQQGFSYGSGQIASGYTSSSSTASRPQALMVYPDGQGSYSVPSSTITMPVHSQAYPHMVYSTMPNGQHPILQQSSGYASGSSTGISHQNMPWYFDSGATAHVTNDASQITVPNYAPPTTVTVGNGHAVPVSNSGLDHKPSSTPGTLPSGSLSPSAFF